MAVLDDFIKLALQGRYPEVMPPIMKTDKGKTFAAKQLSAEANQVKKVRDAANKRIQAGDYDPYFDISKRFPVDRTKYPEASQPNQTLQVMKKKPETVEKYRKMYNDPEALKRLQEAYMRGLDIPDTSGWYFMGQLENEFIQEFGEEAGPKMFSAMFSDPMAAWTGGADPTANLLMATFDNFRRMQGDELPSATHQYPFPIGGRFLGTNAFQAEKLAKQGTIDSQMNPKRFNFKTNFEGADDRATMDEQMMTIGYGMKAPSPGTYGNAEEPIFELADKAGTTPMNFQEVTWHGGSGKVGKPMIQFVNEAIERTSAVTGMKPADVVKGMVRGSIPIFGLGAAATIPGTDVRTQDVLSYIGQSNG